MELEFDPFTCPNCKHEFHVKAIQKAVAPDIKEFEYIKVKTDSGVKTLIESCSNNKHFHQVAYSTYGRCLTMICFNDRIIVSSYSGG